MPNPTQATEISQVSWRLFLLTTLESLLAFYLATFCVAMFFIHREGHVVLGVLLAVLYLFVIVVCAQRVMKKLSLATLMLIIPIAPFIALTMVISLIPILQFFAR